MNRNVSTRVLTAPARPARPTALRNAPRFQPKKKSIVGRICRWIIPRCQDRMSPIASGSTRRYCPSAWSGNSVASP